MFDRNICRELRKEIVDLLQKRFPQFHVESHTGKFSQSNFTTLIEFAVINQGVAETEEAQAFKRNARFFGLEPDDLGKTFHSIATGKKMEITGAKPRNHKYPIIAKCASNGKAYKFSAREVMLGLGRNTPNPIGFRRG
jgi:hypothetical protein